MQRIKFKRHYHGWKSCKVNNTKSIETSDSVDSNIKFLVVIEGQSSKIGFDDAHGRTTIHYHIFVLNILINFGKPMALTSMQYLDVN